MITSKNPLLAGGFRLPFHQIEARHVEPGIREALARARAEIDAVAEDGEPPSWTNTMGALERTVETLGECLAPVTHLVTVAETAALREAYNAVLPEITAFWSRLPLNTALWRRIKAYAATPDAHGLNGIRRRHLEKTMREFRHAGADLPPDAKARLEEVRIELARLQQTFSENVLDSPAAYELLVTDEQRLAGVPTAARRRAREKAQAKGKKKGWLLTLDYPSVEPILKHCHDRALRREIHLAYATRCRDGDFDNRGILARILRLRDELAEILGYESFPDYALEDRMAGSGARAIEFEADLVERTRPYWERDVAQLRAHASELGIEDLEPWDASYVMEHLRRKRYDIDDETLRPYFPLPRVLEGLFEIVRRTFGFRIEEREISEVWHEDVRYFELFDEADGTMVGAFYSDWFPRPEKRQGAWMNHFITGGPRPAGFAPHLGVICGNFTPPDGNGPALLTHREVETTFHEFGHLLHHCTSRVPVPSRAGINVAWDFVELPSQLMENWTWEREALDLFAGHHETGEPLPHEIFERMRAARRYMGGWAQMRQLSLGTVDLALHGELAPRLRAEVGSGPSPALDRRQRDAVMEFGEERFAAFAAQPRFAQLHMLTSFTHLFAGGYAAAYYSYLWSEVLDADVFTRFRAEGIFDRETGRRYVEAILSRGDSADPDQLFLEFMGRPPDPSALLERNLGPLADA
ncbi:MAG TPA: M3 family metallopeptidase [Longimicrobiales bacterium]|nr:M3 family metallopeptidase [Longimicrobiales bacterium]